MLALGSNPSLDEAENLSLGFWQPPEQSVTAEVIWLDWLLKIVISTVNFTVLTRSFSSLTIIFQQGDNMYVSEVNPNTKRSTSERTRSHKNGPSFHLAFIARFGRTKGWLPTSPSQKTWPPCAEAMKEAIVLWKSSPALPKRPDAFQKHAFVWPHLFPCRL